MFIDVNRLSLIQLLAIKNQACSDFSLQMTVFYREKHHTLSDVIVPYFVYCEER